MILKHQWDVLVERGPWDQTGTSWFKCMQGSELINQPRAWSHGHSCSLCTVNCPSFLCFAAFSSVFLCVFWGCEGWIRDTCITTRFPVLFFFFSPFTVPAPDVWYCLQLGLDQQGQMLRPPINGKRSPPPTHPVKLAHRDLQLSKAPNRLTGPEQSASSNHLKILYNTTSTTTTVLISIYKCCLKQTIDNLIP